MSVLPRLDASLRETLAAMAGESAEIRRTAGGPVAVSLAGWLAASRGNAGEQGLDLRTLTRNLVAPRQGDHSAARML